MSSPLIGPGNEALLRQIEQERAKRQATPPPQRLPSQPPAASSPPPSEAATTADAALLAAQQFAQNRQANTAKREQESAQALQSVDEADRFAQNAQVARQVADESEALSQQQRAEADQLAQIHQQEEAQEAQEEAQVVQQAKDAEVVRVLQDPQVIKETKPDMAQALGVNVKEIDDEVESIYRETQGIFSGQLDTNNARQVALAEKIKTGEGFSKKEKIAMGIAMLLPIVIGAATGNTGRGLQAAGQAIGAISQQREQAQQGLLGERGALEDRQLALAQGKLSNVGEFVDQKGKISDIDIRQQKAGRDAATQALTDKGEKLKNLVGLKRVQQADIAIDTARLKLEKIAEGEPEGDGRPPSEAQTKAAGFALKMKEAVDIFSDLKAKGFEPKRGEFTSIAPELKSPERQLYEHSVILFGLSQLRDESGAAIGEHEFDKIESLYFPLAGESAAKKNAKLRARVIATGAMEAKAGKLALKNARQRMQELADELGVNMDVSAVTEADMQAELTKVREAVNSEDPGGAFAGMSEEDLKKRFNELGGE